MKSLFRIIVLTLTAGCGLYLTLAGQTQNPAVGLQRAIQLETVDGDLNAAIEQYKQVIQKNGGNRAVAAQALLRLAGCYEKLGQEEARKTYQQLVNDYADQQQEVKLARQRLAALAKATEAVASAPKFRRIEIPGKPPVNSAAMLSPDGNRFAFVAEGSIWTVPISGGIHPDIAGEPVRLTKDMGAWEAGNCTVTWSTDGQWIAFRGKPNDSVYLVPASGGEPRRVDGIGPGPGGAQVSRISVSQAARRVVFAAGAENELASRLFTIPGEGGRPTQLAAGAGLAFEPAFSPNGKLVAYLKRERADNGWVDSIMAVPADGGEPLLFSSLPAGHMTDSPTWSPDGKLIAFPVGTEDGGALWIVPVSSEGKPEAEPTKLDLKPVVMATLHGKSVRKFMDPLGGWSSRNEIAFLFETPNDSAIYRVPASGGRATLIALDGREPRWSPDGKRVYFRGNGDKNIESAAAEGGDVRSVPIRYKTPMIVWFPTGSNEVSRDGRSIVFAGGFRGDGQRPAEAGIFTVPSQGGDARLVVAGSALRNPSWSPDGKWIAYTQSGSAPDSSTGIWIVASEGGSPKQLTSDAVQVAEGEVRWSPDGKTIAYFGADKTLRLIPSTGGGSRVLTQVPVGTGFLGFLGLSWSPDGSKLAYTTIQKTWVIPASGGEPREIPVGYDGRILQIDWSPDGLTLAFTGATGGEEEVWLMSDFLHLVKPGR